MTNQTWFHRAASRREFIFAGAGAMCALGLAARADEPLEHQGRVMTVMGPIEPRSMDVTLSHEHVLVDFIGWKETGKHRYDEDDAFRVILPHLRKLRRLGCKTLVECTPNYIGRDPALLLRLARESDLHLLTNTGIYGAANEKFVPDSAREASADQLADEWVKEWREGIGDTGVRPGFIKTGVNNGPLSELDRKLFRAACRTHKRTGLTIACHTGGGGAINDELDILEDEGLAGEALIWVHAQNERDFQLHARAARLGVWVSFDGVSTKNRFDYVTRLKAMKDRGLLHRVLISHDAGWYSPGEPEGGDFRPYDAVFTALIPELRQSGFDRDELHRLVTKNPQTAFTIQTRLA
ncbi:MAG: phosphotriesterase [bacterium]|nr:phosphotriesterase [bacterium]